MNNVGRISRIQGFSMGDGDGIRTTVFMQGCNLKCAWCHNPETQPTESVILNYSKDKATISGEEITAKELFEKIVKDELFYIESGGGVTFSGGEPLLQADFCAEVAKMCKEKGINVLFDTAGSVPYECFEKVLPYTDTFYFDVKAVKNKDCQIHKCGNPELVLSNLERLCKASNVVVRIPVIPNHNHSKQKMLEIANAIAHMNPARVDLLPFHRLGSGKYKALNMDYVYAQTEPLKKSDLEEYVPIFESKGLKCTIEN